MNLAITRNMKLTVTRSHIELIVGTVATLLTGWLCVYASGAFRSIYAEMYGRDAAFALVTRIALAAHLWCPILLGAGLIAFVGLAIRDQENRKPFGALMALNLFVTLLTSYGFFEPLLHTTFQMNKS